MINLVGHDGEEQTGHLAESEVAHLLSTLQNAEFTRSETRNLQKDKSFKPRSLIEIASAAQARETEVKLAGAVANHASDMTDLTDELPDTVAQSTLKNLSNNDPDLSTSEDLSPDKSTLEPTVFPLTVNKVVEALKTNLSMIEEIMEWFSVGRHWTIPFEGDAFVSLGRRCLFDNLRHFCNRFIGQLSILRSGRCFCNSSRTTCIWVRESKELPKISHRDHKSKSSKRSERFVS